MKTVTVMVASVLSAVIARSDSDEAIQLSSRGKAGLLRFARNDEFDTAHHNPLPDMNASAIVEL
jgi:hypothetical protein